MSQGRLDPASARQFLHRLPKCEHHIHIEGSLSPSLLFKLAERNAIELPSQAIDVAYASIESLEARYRNFSSLDDFLAYYNRASAVLVARQDFEELAYAYMTRAHADGIVHTEPSFDLQTHTSRGIATEDVVLGLHAGLKRGAEDYGISYRLILCILRHLSVDDCVEHVRMAKPYFDDGTITGMGMCSTEKEQPPSKFQPAFDLAKQFGVKHFTAHAGEEGPADYVRQAIVHLGVNRIDHGVRSVEDDNVLHMLSQQDTLLTVCPTSNVCLKVHEHLHQVPLRTLLDWNIKFSINSDDPAYFGAYLLDTFTAVHDAFHFTPREWRTIVANGIEGSWMAEERKQELIAQLNGVVAEFHPN